MIRLPIPPGGEYAYVWVSVSALKYVWPQADGTCIVEGCDGGYLLVDTSADTVAMMSMARADHRTPPPMTLASAAAPPCQVVAMVPTHADRVDR